MDTAKKTILILEDETPLSDVIKSKFEREGFSTLTARSVNEALDYRKNNVAVSGVWLDHYLFGKENGMDFVKEIKKKGSAWKQVPVFVVSNTISPEKFHKYLSLGAQKCYTKVDFRADEIVAEMKAFLK